MDLAYSYHKKECFKCHRKILVEIFDNGVSHTVGLTVVCSDCITFPLQPEFTKEHPEAAKDISDWVKEY